jgi:alpha-L-fucosidase 2
MNRFQAVAFTVAIVLACPLFGQSPANGYDVTWDSPGKSYKDSMPIGNGDLGLNLWTEENGDVVFLIDKTDAWTENSQLVKLGRIRVKFAESPFRQSPAFRQILNPKEGAIEIRGESTSVLRIWVDANAPVIHLEMRSGKPLGMQASAEIWRTEARRTNSARGNDETGNALREQAGNPERGATIDPDTILPAKNNRLTWLHYNTRSLYPSLFENQHLDPLLGKFADPLLHRAFGVLMKGAGLVSADRQTLKSAGLRQNFRLDLYALTTLSGTAADWQTAMDKTVARADAIGIDAARKAHRQWWSNFWNRSWIHVTGDDNAAIVTQGYAMQRWMAATEGRGASPMKFNGGMFTVGQEPPPGTPYDPAKGQKDPDYRAWGSNYWFQNQRLLYWPMIAAGDFDTLAPFYNMFLEALPLAKARTELIYKHAGAVFPETMFFWGLPNNNDFGWGRQETEMASRWIRWHVNNGLELTTMMLDAWDITQDAQFARKTLLPLAVELTTYFDRHWPRVGGKLHFEPSAALETRQSATNPAPDIAGLMDVLPRLLAMPRDLTTAAQRAMWQKTLSDLPPLPRGHADEKGKMPLTDQAASPTGAEILWPAEKFAKFENSENPELYSVFPFRIFGVGLPELELARATYDARFYKGSTCWGQDGIHAACLGWATKARVEAIANFTDYGSERFKWFWKPGHDWEPDLDNGGAGQTILQSMLLQQRGDRILLFPAWPSDWNVDFKLHAAKNTVIEGVWKSGKLEKLTVTPASRQKDIVRMSPQ